jgi:hypothetical protein
MDDRELPMDALEPFVGEWDVEAEVPGAGPGPVRGTTSFRWLWGRRFLEQRADVDHPEAPDGRMIVAPDPRGPGAFVQHYFDSRGVVRL